MQLDAEMVERALSDTIGIFRMAAEFLEVLDFFLPQLKLPPSAVALFSASAHTPPAPRTHTRDILIPGVAALVPRALPWAMLLAGLQPAAPRHSLSKGSCHTAVLTQGVCICGKVSHRRSWEGMPTCGADAE